MWSEGSRNGWFPPRWDFRWWCWFRGGLLSCLRGMCIFCAVVWFRKFPADPESIIVERGDVSDEYMTCTFIMNGCCDSRLCVLTAELVEGDIAPGLFGIRFKCLCSVSRGDRGASLSQWQYILSWCRHTRWAGLRLRLPSYIGSWEEACSTSCRCSGWTNRQSCSRLSRWIGQSSNQVMLHRLCTPFLCIYFHSVLVETLL